jgi:hypothetical protein
MTTLATGAELVCLTDAAYRNLGRLGQCLRADEGSSTLRVATRMLSMTSPSTIGLSILAVFLAYPHVLAHLRQTRALVSWQCNYTLLLASVVELGVLASSQAWLGALFHTPSPCSCYVNQFPVHDHPSFFSPPLGDSDAFVFLAPNTLATTYFAAIFANTSLPGAVLAVASAAAAEAASGQANILQIFIAIAVAVVYRLYTLNTRIMYRAADAALSIIGGALVIAASGAQTTQTNALREGAVFCIGGATLLAVLCVSAPTLLRYLRVSTRACKPATLPRTASFVVGTAWSPNASTGDLGSLGSLGSFDPLPVAPPSPFPGTSGRWITLGTKAVTVLPVPNAHAPGRHFWRFATLIVIAIMIIQLP